MRSDFFKKLKIIELAGILAGPKVGMFFAELGAKVLKIEHPLSGGDLTRQWKLPSEDPSKNYSAYYASINWGKQVMMLNLKKEEDFQILKKELQDTDIVISNYRDSVAERLKVDFKSIHAINPSIIFAQLIGFLDQPERPSFDMVLQAEAGFLSMTGQSPDNPVKMPVALIDVLAAHQLKEAILIALLLRSEQGKGVHIKLSLFQAAVSALVNQATNFLMAGHIPQPIGMAHPNIAPYGDFYRTKDNKKIVLAIGNDAQFLKLCKVLSLTELASDERFFTNTHRVKNRTSLNEILEKQFAIHDSTALYPALLKAQVPAGLIRNLEEVFKLPEAQRLILEEISPEGVYSRRVATKAFHFVNT